MGKKATKGRLKSGKRRLGSLPEAVTKLVETSYKIPLTAHFTSDILKQDIVKNQEKICKDEGRDVEEISILLGLLGLIGVGINYPIYKKLLLAGKKQYAFEIIQLAREISDGAE